MLVGCKENFGFVWSIKLPFEFLSKSPPSKLCLSLLRPNEAFLMLEDFIIRKLHYFLDYLLVVFRDFFLVFLDCSEVELEGLSTSRNFIRPR